MKFKKVCYFLPSSQRDGAELSALECMDALKALGMQCHVVMPMKGPLIADLEARQISYQIIPYRGWIMPPTPVWNRLLCILWNLFITYPAILLVSRWKCDLIITNTVNIFVGALVAKILGLPHVWYIREFGFEDHGWDFHLGEKASLWIINRLADLYLAVSQAVAQKYQAGITSSKVHYLYQPIYVNQSSRLDIPLARDDHDFTCIIVGVLQEGKRQEDAIRAIGVLRDQGIPVKLWVVGGGNRVYTDFLATLVRKNNLADRVKFFGQVNNPFPYMKKADVFLLCSRCEAFARVVVEAMKAGKPVLGARSGGTVEQVMEGFNGFLYEPGDFRELAAKIKVLYSHPQKAKEMGKNAQNWAMKTFNKNRYQGELARILGTL